MTSFSLEKVKTACSSLIVMQGETRLNGGSYPKHIGIVCH